MCDEVCLAEHGVVEERGGADLDLALTQPLQPIHPLYKLVMHAKQYPDLNAQVVDCLTSSWTGLISSCQFLCLFAQDMHCHS